MGVSLKGVRVGVEEQVLMRVRESGERMKSGEWVFLLQVCALGWRKSCSCGCASPERG